MKGERLVQTMILAAVGLALFGVIRPDSPDPQEDAVSHKTWFFINKTHQGPDYTAVIIGDSRALRGVSPGEMSAELDGTKIFNFSFHAGGMNKEMYQEGEKLIADGMARPVIVLAPTALSFLPSKASNSQFHEYRDKPRDQVWIYRHWPDLAFWFQPVSPSIYIQKSIGYQPAKLLFQDFQADGWIATDQDPRDDLADLSLHRARLAGLKVAEARIQELMQQTRQWSDRGFRVFGFFPPAYGPRVAQEDSMLGFDRVTFVQSFRSAGGTWLDLEDPALESYDGSHLDRASAVKLSRALARGMAPFL